MKFSHTQLALRNVFRNTRRTVITGAILSVGCIALMITQGFIQYTFHGLREQTIRQGMGHLQVFDKEWGKKPEIRFLDQSLPSADSLIKEIERLDGVRFAMKRLEWDGLVSNGDISIMCIGRGVEPIREQRLSTYFVTLQQGAMLEARASDSIPQVMIGKSLARKLRSKPGDRLTLLANTRSGALNALDARLVGIFSTGIPDYDIRTVMVTLPTASELLQTDRSRNIVVVLEESGKTDLMREKVQGLLPGLSVRTWYDLSPFYKQVVGLYSSAFRVFTVVVVVVVILSVFNTMLMSVIERTGEIGALMAMGMARKDVIRMFVSEGALLGLFFTLAGIAVGTLVIFGLNAMGLRMPPPPGQTTGYPLMVEFAFPLMAGLLVCMPALAALSSTIPSWLAARKRIVQALSHY
jgi:putative ABC transport system permease protein